MSRHRLDAQQECRLKIVFDEAVMSMSVAVGTTLEDVSCILGSLPLRRYGYPVAIDLIFPDPAEQSIPVSLRDDHARDTTFSPRGTRTIELAWRRLHVDPERIIK